MVRFCPYPHACLRLCAEQHFNLCFIRSRLLLALPSWQRGKKSTSSVQPERVSQCQFVLPDANRFEWTNFVLIYDA